MPKELLAPRPGEAVLNDYQDVSPKKGQVLVRTEYSSCKHGTEMWIFHGKARWMKWSYNADLRILCEGRKASPFPAKLGNMAVGVVEKLGDGVENLKVGDRVFFHAPARDTHTIGAARVTKLPPEMSWQDAVCVDPAEFAFGALRDSHVRIGDRVGVFGLGAIGLLCIQMAKLQGAEIVVAIDPVAKRREIALQTGADIALHPTVVDVGLEIRKQIDKTGLDVAIEYSGSPRALHDAIRSVGYEGTVVAGAVYKPATADLDLGMEFHWNRIKIISSRACSEPDCDYPRWSRQRIIESVIKLLRRKKLITEPIVQPVVPFAEAPEHYMRIEKEPDKYIKLSFKH